MPASPSFARVAAGLGGSVINAERIEGGSSAEVWKLSITSADAGAKTAVRPVVYRSHHSNDWKTTDPSTAAKEFEVLSVLTAHRLRVAKPLLLIESEQAIVSEWVEGSSLVDDSWLDSALEQMVDFLVGLHRFDLGLVASAALPPIEDPAACLAQYLPDVPASAEIKRRLDAAMIPAPSNAPVLLHGDYWPGNILWHDRRLNAVIDWEDTCVGDPLADLAGARVELLCQYGSQAMQSFSDGYSSAMALDTTALALWECYVSASALASMHRWGLDRAEEARRRALTTAFFERAAGELLARP